MKIQLSGLHPSGSDSVGEGSARECVLQAPRRAGVAGAAGVWSAR